MRLGIFGGTFDPPHWGHLRLAEAARSQLRLDRVLWVVTADPPHKHGQPISAVQDRLDMVLAAIAGEAAYELSRAEIDRPGPHWAADTVALLAAQYPGAQLVYLMGGDSLRDLPRWVRPQAFLAHCGLGVLRRPGDAIDLAALERRLPGLTAKVEFIQAPPLDIASHEIRRRARQRLALEDLVPEAVARIIQARHLYDAESDKQRNRL
jgi:nicotinate-nucleotide adenylyltransferase